MRTFLFSFLLMLLVSISDVFSQSVFVLGTAQDGGFPHIGCKDKCLDTYKDPSLKRFVVSLAVTDPKTKKWWLMEATPDMVDQLQYFQELTNGEYTYLPEGIFITHAHMGHYTGLMELGREALGANKLAVYALPKLQAFLSSNGPWSQLVKLENISLQTLAADVPVTLTDQLQITAFTVPHRDEFSETAGFKIEHENKYLFIPDIDKWSKWTTDIKSAVAEVDYAFLDASFYADGELPNRAIEEVPHPFVTETMSLFSDEADSIKSKIRFIHFNHTNPLLWDASKQSEIQDLGFNLAEQGKGY
ncbi:MAG: pyrroloquinoline quinone biosynthesis protein B [Paraglaciecola sp.]|jgi:pyrroloquinoline quinone biosynthesis protein B